MRKVELAFTLLTCIALLLTACISPTPRASDSPDGTGLHPIPDTASSSGATQPAAQALPINSPGATGAPAIVSVSFNANLRAGPGTTFPVAGQVQAGTELRVIATNATGDWLQLEDESWIFADLVSEPPHVPVAAAEPGASNQPAASAQPSGQLRVHFIDVGQGDSILIQSPDGANALIDGGLAGFGALRYLQAQGVRKLDLVVATHPHADHVGGLPEILRTIPASLIVASGQSLATPDYEALLDAITQEKVPYREVKRGSQLPIGMLILEVLSPSQIRPKGDPNHNSLVLRLIYGQTAFQFEADADQDAENAMRAAGVLRPVTLLKVGHHGSRSSSAPAFLRAIKPRYAVYSAMLADPYGYPHAETVAALNAVNAQIHGTDREGTIVATSDGSQVTLAGSRWLPFKP